MVPGRQRVGTYVSKSNGTAANVDLAPVETQDLFSANTDNRERLVELPESNVLLLDAGLFQCNGHGQSRGSREVDRGASGISKACRSVTVGPVIRRNYKRHTENLGNRLQALLVHHILTSQDERTGTVIQCRAVGGSHGPVLPLESALQAPKLFLQQLLVVLVLGHDHVALAGLDGDGGNLLLEQTLGPGRLCALVRGEAKVVLVLARDLVLFGSVLGAVAHGEFVVDVKEAVGD